MHPYEDQPPRAFWARTIAKDDMPFEGIWQPKFPLGRHARIAMFGSCFAQHFKSALARRGLNWVNAEPAPEGLSDANVARFNYHVFSARTGTIYTAAMLHQWCRWALTDEPAPDEVWAHNGRFFDPMRPSIEPDGFETEAELLASRAATIAAFARAVTEADIFVFTLGLTEAWVNAVKGFEYAICPGVVAGRFHPACHDFVNHRFGAVTGDLEAAIGLMRGANPRLNVLLTVSPVPLTATATKRHVLVATTQSKAVLRAAAGDVADRHGFVDYFPSYEIVTSGATASAFYEANRRTVSAHGVDTVMATLFEMMGVQPIGRAPQAPPTMAPPKTQAAPAADPACLEELLAAFGRGV